MRVVIAPDSFKGSATARQAATAIAAGWLAERPTDEVRLVPMADGGEGTLDAFETALPDARRERIDVVGPDDRVVSATWLRFPTTEGETGVVELAETSGLTLMRAPRPLDAHVLGFGQAIGAALDAGVHRLLLAIGGSASTDGGAAMLAALGARLLDASGRSIPLGGRGLLDLDRVDLSDVRLPPVGGVEVLTDVTNPLLGPDGAAAVFGEQKGADEQQRRMLDRALAQWASFFSADRTTPGAGAAGGVGFGALVWGAEILSGATAIAEAVDLPDAIAGADLVLTGEGRYDGQTAGGKAPAVVRALAARAGVPVALVAGSIGVDPAGFGAARSLVDLAGGLPAAMSEPLRWLERAGAELARDHPAE